MFFGSLAVLNVVLTFVLLSRLASFTKRHPTLSTRDDLDRYRSLITVHMWGALVLMGIMLVLPLGIAAPAILHGGYVAVDWWPLGVMAIPMLFRSRIGAIEAGCRALQVSPSLADEYATINRVWASKALPKFPTHTELALEPSSHGDSSAHESVRAKGLDDDLTLRRNSYVMTSIGLGDAAFGMLALLDSELPELHVFAAVLLVVGGITFVGATLLGLRMHIGYRVTLACAALHCLLPPIGTALAIWMLVSTRRAKYAVSPEYLDALSRAQVQPTRPWLRHLLLGTVIVYVHGFTIFSVAAFILLVPS